MTRWTGPDRKKTGTGPGSEKNWDRTRTGPDIQINGPVSGFVFTTNRVSGLNQTVPGIRDITRTGPKKNFSLKYIDKDIELLVNVIYTVMYKT